MKRAFFFLLLMTLLLSCDTGTGGGYSGSPYRVTFEVWTDNADYAYTNACILDDEDNRYYGGEFYLSGMELEFIPLGIYYLRYLIPWSEGTTRTYKFELPGDEPVEGELTRPVGSLSGITYAPANPAISNSYTLSPPGGIWPENSVIECRITKDSETKVIRQFPQGTGDYVFSSSYLNDADSVEFYSLLMDEDIPEFYAQGSFVRFYGTKTSW